MTLLQSAGVTVVDCTVDQADTQNEYLAAAVALANRQDLGIYILLIVTKAYLDQHSLCFGLPDDI